MTWGEFDSDDWTDRLAAALPALAKVQEPYLQAYWQHHPREQIIVDGRDVTPFPLDDLRMVYAEARHSRRFGREAEFASLRAAFAVQAVARGTAGGLGRRLGKRLSFRTDRPAPLRRPPNMAEKLTMH